MSESILKTALTILGGALLLCIGGIIWLASAEPARAIPDVLIATTGLVSGGLVGVLVPSRPVNILGKAVDERGAVDAATALLWALVVLVVLAVVFWLVPNR